MEQQEIGHSSAGVPEQNPSLSAHLSALCKRFGCTPEQAKAQFTKNAAILAQMAAQAERTGEKVNGYTAAELREREARARARGL